MIVATSSRTYGLLLRLCPARYRARYGWPMAQAFRDLAREAYARQGAKGIMALWLRALPDVCATALAEQWAALRQDGGARLRALPILLVLFSLFTPWFRFSDGGTFTGWQTVWMSLLPGDWTALHVTLLLMTLSLVAAAVVALGVGPLAARLCRGQPAFLTGALAGIAIFAISWGPWTGVDGVPGALWGAWLTAGCIGTALALEGALWIGARR